ncbi:LOW QUALITY PROTEIN: vomeronasal type-1 receptor 4-like [Sarcophilus harrisii]|uniref:LOW QUALITY PROTEIN: vomeronasal type-1 receptor 4-like n=1 Tax=Sarcophilus harrisii TaxID=9305 RepID=UPI00062B8C22|nr:LOW QUALITY PROTEIN: vomeronasal type-1 receptor 4-like [Sarcophilus harrisii]
MLTLDEILGIVYLQLTGIGCLGNLNLLILNSFNFFTAHKVRPKNVIINHLAFSNAMVLLFRGIPTITRLWKVKCVLDRAGIKIITYMQTISWGLSLYSTCLLSVFQAITISPINSMWAQLKFKASKCIIPSIVLCWIFNLLLDMLTFLRYDGPKNSTVSKYGCNTGYRALDIYNNNHIKLEILACVHDTFFACLMMFSSIHMVLILYRHKRNVNHIHSNSTSTKVSPETRATQAILLLVATFVLFNIFSPIFILCMFHFKFTNTWMIHTSALLSLCYPTVNPFILINISNQIPSFCAQGYFEKLFSLPYPVRLIHIEDLLRNLARWQSRS